MADKGQEVTIDEIAISNMYSIEALVNVLELKGLLTKKEILDEINRIKLEQRSGKN